MTKTNSTPKPDFSSFCNDLGYKIWENHAAAIGLEALLIKAGWEDSSELTAAKYLINRMQDDLEALAQLVDESALSYVFTQTKDSRNKDLLESKS